MYMYSIKVINIKLEVELFLFLMANELSDIVAVTLVADEQLAVRRWGEWEPEVEVQMHGSSSCLQILYCSIFLTPRKC